MLSFQNRSPIWKTSVASSVRLKHQYKSFSVSSLETSFWTVTFSLHHHTWDALRYIKGAGWWHGMMTVASRAGHEVTGDGAPKQGMEKWQRTGHYCPGVKWNTRGRMFFWWVWRLSEMKTKERFVGSNFNQTSSFFLAFRAQYPAYLCGYMQTVSMLCSWFQ